MIEKNIITITERGQIVISGVSRVISASVAQAVLEIGGANLVIMGSEFEVKKLDVENGSIEMIGKFDGMKFIEKKERLSLFKKVFK